MTALEALLSDPGNTGVWTLAPDRSAVTFRCRSLWGLLPVKGRFTEVHGEGRLGENASLTLAERESVIRAAVEVVNGRVPVLSGLAEITTALGRRTSGATVTDLIHSAKGGRHDHGRRG